MAFPELATLGPLDLPVTPDVLLLELYDAMLRSCGCTLVKLQVLALNYTYRSTSDCLPSQTRCYKYYSRQNSTTCFPLKCMDFPAHVVYRPCTIPPMHYTAHDIDLDHNHPNTKEWSLHALVII